LIKEEENIRAVLAQYHAEHMNVSGYMIVQGDNKFIYYRAGLDKSSVCEKIC